MHRALLALAVGAEFPAGARAFFAAEAPASLVRTALIAIAFTATAASLAAARRRGRRRRATTLQTRIHFGDACVVRRKRRRAGEISARQRYLLKRAPAHGGEARSEI